MLTGWLPVHLAFVSASRPFPTRPSRELTASAANGRWKAGLGRGRGRRCYCHSQWRSGGEVGRSQGRGGAGLSGAGRCSRSRVGRLAGCRRSPPTHPETTLVRVGASQGPVLVADERQETRARSPGVEDPCPRRTQARGLSHGYSHGTTQSDG